jgi:uncharacterized membrane protein YsdA (DUF1294 family)
MEPEGSLPHSQEPTTCPYPEPGQSKPVPPRPTPWRVVLHGFFPSTPGSCKWSPVRSPHTKILHALLIFLLRAGIASAVLDGDRRATSRPERFTPSVNFWGTHLIWGWVGRIVGLDVSEEKHCLAPLDSKLLSSGPYCGHCADRPDTRIIK